MGSFLRFRSKSIKVLVVFVILAFAGTSIVPPGAFAQGINLPLPGTMVTTSPAYTPAIVAGITIHPDNPLQLDFVVDTGDDNLQGEELQEESKKLINYFLAALTVPEDELWVNLSPYEENRIIADGLSQTEMGRDMLAMDYLLKQLTASLMYPEEELGSEFWKKIRKKTQAKLGTTEVPTNTFNKIWIVPDEAAVYVHDTNVFVNRSHLKVMLEEDYLALESNKDSIEHGLGDVTQDRLEAISEETKQAIREVIIPEIEREVNEGKNFANLRQIYHSMILATWYKKNLRESLLGQVYMDRNKVNGIDLAEKGAKEKIYNQYVEAFKKGVYNYIKEDYDSATQKVIPRKYFSGGLREVAGASLAEDDAVGKLLANRANRQFNGYRVTLKTDAAIPSAILPTPTPPAPNPTTSLPSTLLTIGTGVAALTVTGLLALRARQKRRLKPIRDAFHALGLAEEFKALGAETRSSLIEAYEAYVQEGTSIPAAILKKAGLRKSEVRQAFLEHITRNKKGVDRAMVISTETDSGRRQFLKLLGLSAGAAAASAYIPNIALGRTWEGGFYSVDILRARLQNLLEQIPDGFRFLPDYAGTTKKILLQYNGGEHARRYLSEILNLLPAEIDVAIAYQTGDSFNELSDLVAREQKKRQVDSVFSPNDVSIWARDGFVPVLNSKGDVVLLRPANRSRDAEVSLDLSENFLDVQHLDTDFTFEGGNFLFDDAKGQEVYFFGENALDWNTLIFDSSRRRQELEALEGNRRLVLLPSFDGSSHVDTYVTFLKDKDGEKVAVVGTYKRVHQMFSQSGQSVQEYIRENTGDIEVSGSRNMFAQLRRTEKSLDATAAKLKEMGYKIKRIPFIRGLEISEGDRPSLLITYNNVLFLDSKTLVMGTYGIPTDQVAKTTYEELGYTVLTVDVKFLRNQLGAVRCTTNRLHVVYDKALLSHDEHIDEVGKDETMAVQSDQAMGGDPVSRRKFLEILGKGAGGAAVVSAVPKPVAWALGEADAENPTLVLAALEGEFLTTTDVNRMSEIAMEMVRIDPEFIFPLFDALVDSKTDIYRTPFLLEALQGRIPNEEYERLMEELHKRFRTMPIKELGHVARPVGDVPGKFLPDFIWALYQQGLDKELIAKLDVNALQGHIEAYLPFFTQILFEHDEYHVEHQKGLTPYEDYDPAGDIGALFQITDALKTPASRRFFLEKLAQYAKRILGRRSSVDPHTDYGDKDNREHWSDSLIENFEKQGIVLYLVSDYLHFYDYMIDFVKENTHLVGEAILYHMNTFGRRLDPKLFHAFMAVQTEESLYYANLFLQNDPEGGLDWLNIRPDDYRQSRYYGQGRFKALDAAVRLFYKSEFSQDKKNKMAVLLYLVENGSKTWDQVAEIAEDDVRFAQAILEIIHGAENTISRSYLRNLIRKSTEILKTSGLVQTQRLYMDDEAKIVRTEVKYRSFFRPEVSPLLAWALTQSDQIFFPLQEQTLKNLEKDAGAEEFITEYASEIGQLWLRDIDNEMRFKEFYAVLFKGLLLTAKAYENLDQVIRAIARVDLKELGGLIPGTIFEVEHYLQQIDTTIDTQHPMLLAFLNMLRFFVTHPENFTDQNVERLLQHLPAVANEQYTWEEAASREVLDLREEEYVSTDGVDEGVRIDALKWWDESRLELDRFYMKMDEVYRINFSAPGPDGAMGARDQAEGQAAVDDAAMAIENSIAPTPHYMIGDAQELVFGEISLTPNDLLQTYASVVEQHIARTRLRGLLVPDPSKRKQMGFSGMILKYSLGGVAVAVKTGGRIKDELNQLIRDELYIIHRFWRQGLRKYLPKPALSEAIDIPVAIATREQGQPKIHKRLTLPMAIYQWFEGYQNLTFEDGKWKQYEDTTRPKHDLPEEDVQKVPVEVAAAIAYHASEADGRVQTISGIYLNAGHFIYRKHDDGTFDIQLTAVKGLRDDITIPRFIYDFITLGVPEVVDQRVVMTPPAWDITSALRGLVKGREYRAIELKRAWQFESIAIKKAHAEVKAWLEAFAADDLGQKYRDKIQRFLVQLEDGSWDDDQAMMHAPTERVKAVESPRSRFETALVERLNPGEITPPANRPSDSPPGGLYSVAVPAWALARWRSETGNIFIDNAMVPQRKKGGIDLNPAHVDFEMHGEKIQFDFPFDPALLNMEVDGLYPVIINVTPVNINTLLGLTDNEDESEQISLNPARDPADRKNRKYLDKLYCRV